MQSLRIAIGAIFGAGFVASTPASAQQPFDPTAFRNAASVFVGADLNRNGSLSSQEYWQLRTGAVGRQWASDPRAFQYNLAPQVIHDFAQIDRDNNGVITRAEFMPSAARWHPQYVTLSYYLLANRVDTDKFKGRPVTNLNGQELGRIHRITRHEDTGQYYALVVMREKVADPTPTQLRAKAIGIPLDEMLLATSGSNVFLTNRGERFFLMEADMPRVSVEKLKPVQNLYAV